jgi:hypothetical protein
MTDAERKLTAVEWRLYIVALLGAVYVVTWRVLDRPPRATSTAPPPADVVERPRATTSPVPPTRGAERASDRVRPGPQRLVEQPTPRPVRVPAPRRVRTRSS